MKKLLSRGILIAMLFSTLFSQSVFAEETPKVMQAVTDDSRVKIYVKGIESEPTDITYQIGTKLCEDVKTYDLAQDDQPVATLIMIDNSLSVSEENRAKANQIFTDLIASRIDQETFRIASFGDHINYLSEYSNDYVALKQTLDGITYQDQETYLTDVLYDVIGELDTENRAGYSRIIIFSDGVDNKSIGITKDELYEKLKGSPYPIYTMGTKSKNNDTELENMFALSRMTNGNSYILDEVEDTMAITNEFNADHDIRVIEASLNNISKDGSNPSTKLNINGTELSFGIKLPFDVEQEVIEEPETEVVSEVEEQTVEEEPEEEFPWIFQYLWVLGIIIPLVLIGSIVTIIVLIVKSKKRKDQVEDDEISYNYQNIPQAEEHTEIVNENPSGPVTEMLFGNQESIYKIVIRDRVNQGRIYQCELKGTATIGRSQQNDIVIDYDKSVSSRHCEIAMKNNQVTIRDLNSGNGTMVNGIKVIGETALSNEDVLKLGRVELVVEIKKS